MRSSIYDEGTVPPIHDSAGSHELSDFNLVFAKVSEIIGFVLDEKTPLVTCEMNGYKLEISLDELFGHKATLGYGLVMADGINKFIGAGSGFRVKFLPLDNISKDIIGVSNIDEGTFKDGIWLPGRRLNGDEDDQGRAWRFGFRQTAIEKCIVYHYE